MKETVWVSHRPCSSCGRQKSKQHLFTLWNFCEAESSLGGSCWLSHGEFAALEIALGLPGVAGQRCAEASALG